MPKRTRLQMRAAAQKQQFNNSGYKRRKLGSAVIAQGGVYGAKAYVPRSIANRPELKFHDTLISASGNDIWQVLSSASLAGIEAGTGESQRIGRKIRVKGIIFRGRSQLAGSTGTETASAPYTLDFIWDKQCNGAVPSTTTIYTSGSSYALPDPRNDERFKFIKRYEKSDPNSNLTMVNVKINCNEVITYDGSTGAVADLTSTNLLLLYVSPFDATPSMAGRLRILYIDE